MGCVALCRLTLQVPFPCPGYPRAFKKLLDHPWRPRQFVL
jgi:hypothetical protein